MARLAETIIREDQLPVDSFVVAASAYLHDVIDDKVVSYGKVINKDEIVKLILGE